MTGGLIVVALCATAALALGHLVVTARALLTAWRRRIGTAALILPGLILIAWIIGVPLPWQLPATIICVAALLLWRRYLRTADVVTRWGERARRKVGVASGLDVARHGSALALRRKATVLRPSMAELSRWARLRTSAKEFAVPVARVGAFRWLWTSVRNVILVFGGPGYGKSGWIAGRILDAAGAVLVTSTRADLMEITADRRRAKGPVWVFNAVGLGAVPSTLKFDPLVGCDDPTTAYERAGDMLSGDGNEEGDHAQWVAQAIRVLAALMHAAALGGRTMTHVMGWVAEIGPDAERLLGSLLRRSTAPAYVPAIQQFIKTNDRTRTSITATMMPGLAWLTSPVAAACATPGATVDVEELLRSRATVYMLGAQETQSAPLVRALTGHIAREARRIAGLSPKGRLDPHLTLCLDEAGLLAPPLDEWTADMGGRGLMIIAAFQSRAQLLARWTEAEAGVILNNTATVMLFGGTKDEADLKYWSTLAGERDEEVATADEHGRIKSRSVRKVPVFAPAQIANLPEFRVVVFHRGMLPVVARAQMVWNRWDSRLLRAAARVEHLRDRFRLQRTAQILPMPKPKPTGETKAA